MPRNLRDLAATLVALVVLFGMIAVINPRVRERVGQVTSDAQSQQWDSSKGPIANATTAAVATTSSYAADNPFLFVFAVAAVVLFVFMLRT